MITKNFGYLWDLIAVLLRKEIKLRYHGTLLGILWSLANPFAFTAILYIAFKQVLKVEIQDYPLFILSALFSWQWLSNSLIAAPLLFVVNASLIKKLVFPRVALCLAVVLSEMIHFIITLPVYAVLQYASNGNGPGWVWLAGIPILLLAQASLILAAVMILATINVFLRDVEQLVRVFLLFLFYLTPVLYPISMVPQGLRWLLIANPFSPLIISWRSLLFENLLSPYIVVTIAYALLSLLMAIPIYKSMEWKLAEVI